jgi:hypothetical protein
MKIRHGFVGNCSSSSFIVSRGAYQTAFDLAKHMLTIRNADGESWGTIELDKIKLAELAGINENTPVTFSTCNYDTYITPTENGYYVSTCNNTSWTEIAGQDNQGGGHDEGNFQDLEQKTNYWYIKEGLVGTPLSTEEENGLDAKNRYCPQHFQAYVKTLDNQIVCPVCYSKKHNKDMLLTPNISKIKAIKTRKALRFR